MAVWTVEGGTPLYGSVQIGGAKNAALPILFASLLTDGEVMLYRVPDIADVEITCRLLSEMGARVSRCAAHTVCLSRGDFSPSGAPGNLTSRIRASSYLLGVSLALCGRAEMPQTGGCDFGGRPLDLHVAAFSALGVIEHEGTLVAPTGLHAGSYRFPRVSVGATVNAVMAALSADGVSRFENCATEPHVTDFLSFLNLCGARIDGVGTTTLHIHGHRHLTAVSYVLCSDGMEAGTYLCAAAATGGDVRAVGVRAEEMGTLCPLLSETGCRVEREHDSVRVIREGPLRAMDVETAPHPGFPSDLHPPFAAVLCTCNGVGSIRECVWKGRFRYAEELKKMGADICSEGDRVVIRGGELSPAVLSVPDLRGGASLLLASLCAKGESRILHAELLCRGYDSLPSQLLSLGAHIRED